MRRYSLSHLSDPALLHHAARIVSRECVSTADLLAHLAEIDARKLYLGLAYPSMFAYCVGELGLSEDAVAKRIQAARVARRFPAIFHAVAEGRLHLTAVVLLASYLREENAEELLRAATHKSKAEVKRFLAERFPRTDVLALVTAVPSSPQHAPGHVLPSSVNGSQHAPGHVAEDRTGWVQHAPGRVGNGVEPLSAQSFMVQLTLSARRNMTGSATPRSCSAMRSPRATWPRWWSGRWRR